MTGNIKQIIPCNIEMYAVFKDETGKTFHKRVLAFALCDDGCIYPQLFDSEIGVDDCDGAYGYELEDSNNDRIVDVLKTMWNTLKVLKDEIDYVNSHQSEYVLLKDKVEYLERKIDYMLKTPEYVNSEYVKWKEQRK